MHTMTARGYRTRTPSSRTSNSISYTRSANTLLYSSNLPHMKHERSDRGQHAPPRPTEKGKVHEAEEQHTRQVYPTMVRVPSIRIIASKVTFRSQSLHCDTHAVLFFPNTSASTYLKRKQRAKLLIRSIPSDSGKELSKKDDTLWHQSSRGSYTGLGSARKLQGIRMWGSATL
jgi:hypothetical protein